MAEYTTYSKLADFLTKYVYGCYKVFSSKDLTLTGVSSSPRTTEDPGVRLMTRVSSTICAVRNNQGRRIMQQIQVVGSKKLLVGLLISIGP